jgi:hypothetical protein
MAACSTNVLLGPYVDAASGDRWWVYLVVFLGLAILTGPVLQIAWIGRRLITPATPAKPILEWERAGTEARMREILDAWGPSGQRWAAASLGVDLAFLFAYGSAISLACSAAAWSLSDGTRLLRDGFAVAAWGGILAAALDLVENGFLASMLGSFRGEGEPRAMFRVSRLKWRLISVLIPVSLIALVVRLAAGACS